MTTRLLLAFALLFTLSACGNDTASEEVMDDVTADEVAPINPSPGVPDDAPEVDVPGTIAALQGGLTAIPAAAAVDNINGWIAKLEGAGFDGAEEITDNLEELRDELESDEIDGAEVGGLLTRLGELTSAAALGASSSSQDGLNQLAELLSGAGASLGGGDA